MSYPPSRRHSDQIPNVLKALREMPHYVILSGNEEQFRKDTLDRFGVTEENISSFISTNDLFGLSLDEHTLDLQKKAYEYRKDFIKDIEEHLALCYGEEEQMKYLEECDGYYARWASQTDMWPRHLTKSFREFAQWHIEQGGWQNDFQGLKFDEFARAWALAWTARWAADKFNKIGSRRLEEEERQVLESPVLVTNDSSFPTPKTREVPKANGGTVEGKRTFNRENTQPESSHSDKRPAPTLHIAISARQGLFNAISPFVNRSQHADFNDLLHQKIASSPVTIEHQQNSIVYVFKLAIMAGHCDEDKTKVRDWLLYWFRVSDGREVKVLTPRTVYDALTKDMKPAKNKRIPYEP